MSGAQKSNAFFSLGGNGGSRTGTGSGWMTKNREKGHPRDPDIVAVCTIGGVRIEMGAWFEPKRHGYRIQFSLPADAPWRPEDFGPNPDAGEGEFDGVNRPF